MFNLRRLCVEDVAIPKAEIVSVSADIKKSELVSVFRESGLTRLPVYEGTLDNPIGMVHLKDFTLGYAFAKKNTFIVSLFIFSNKFSKSINASCLYSFKGSL